MNPSWGDWHLPAALADATRLQVLDLSRLECLRLCSTDGELLLSRMRRLHRVLLPASITVQVRDGEELGDAVEDFRQGQQAALLAVRQALSDAGVDAVFVDAGWF